MTMEEMLNGIIEELVNKIYAKVIEEVTDTFTDMLNDHDFTDNSSLSDSMTDIIRNEVEDLLSGASISL
jgi:hypothetical protein